MPTNSGWYGLALELQMLGLQVHEPGHADEPSHVIEIDYVRNKALPTNKLVPKSNRFLIATEPVTVNPIQFTEDISDRFFRVIVPSALSPKNKNTVVSEGGYFNPIRYKEFFSNDGARQGCALINENKFSFIQESNYLLRSKFILLALKSKLNLTIAGRNWTRGVLWTAAKLVHHFFIAVRAGRLHFRLKDLILLLNFSFARRAVTRFSLGIVPVSVLFLIYFKGAIVIENESSYVSEKLHAALVAGCQCVYVGPALNPEDFPEGFLFQSTAEVHEIEKNAKLALHRKYSISSSAIREYLRTSDFVIEKGVGRRNAWVANSIFGWIRDAQSKAERAEL